MTDRHQALMDAAYARWQDNRSWSKEDFWDQLSAVERFAVFTGNLTYQVQNGGFSQWTYNNYCTDETLGYLLRACTRMGTPAASKVGELIQSWAEALDQVPLDQQGWALSEEDEEFLNRVSDKLSDEFYEVDDTFLAECGAYLDKLEVGVA